MMKKYIHKIFIATLLLGGLVGSFSNVYGQTGQNGFCVQGNCNQNTYLSSSDPNTIEYDNMVGLFHSTLVREYDGTVKVWGQGIAQNGSGEQGNITAPIVLDGQNFGVGTDQLTGNVLKFTGASNSQNYQQFAVLSTEGLYVWGDEMILVPDGISNVTPGAFKKVAIGTYGVNSGAEKADGLPFNVSPEDVKMLFGTNLGLALVTCDGQAWVLSANGFTYGDGATRNGVNSTLWHRVSTSANTPLEKVVAVRGTNGAFIALTSEGKLFTWGMSTYIGGSSKTNRPFATEMHVPSGVVPKMIGMTNAAEGVSYYLLSTDNRLFSMGNNRNGQLGDSTTLERTGWIHVVASNTIGGKTYSLNSNIAWISPQEHDGSPSGGINVLTTDKKLWAWGYNDGSMLGGSGLDAFIDPTFMPGSISGAYDAGKLNLQDNVIAVETGGHTSLTIKECSARFGYVGHKVNGSMADNSVVDDDVDSYNYQDTAYLMVCGAIGGPIVKDLKICKGSKANLRDAEPGMLPAGFEIKWYKDSEAKNEVTNPSAVPAGLYYAAFTNANSTCPIQMKVEYFVPGDLGYEGCHSLLITNPMVRQQMK